MYLTRAADVRLRSESLPSARRRRAGARNVTKLFPSVCMRPPPPPATLIRLPRLSLLPFRQRSQAGPETPKRQKAGARPGGAPATIGAGGGRVGALVHRRRPQLGQQFRHLLRYFLALARLAGRRGGAATVRAGAESIWETRRSGGGLRSEERRAGQECRGR